MGNGNLTATYTRDPGRNRLASTAIANSQGNIMTVSRQYDAFDRLTVINNVAGSVSRSYNYTYNDRDQRINCTLADGSSWVYAYDNLGQVTSAVKKDAQGKAIPGQSFDYGYDGIGNRQQEARGIAQNIIKYTANNLNQYTQREQSGVVPVFGEADPAAKVQALRTDTNAVSSKRATTTVRDGKYYSGAVTVDNTTEKVVPFDVLAFKDDPTVPNKQLYTRKSSTYTVPQKLLEGLQ